MSLILTLFLILVLLLISIHIQNKIIQKTPCLLTSQLFHTKKAIRNFPYASVNPTPLRSVIEWVEAYVLAFRTRRYYKICRRVLSFIPQPPYIQGKESSAHMEWDGGGRVLHRVWILWRGRRFLPLQGMEDWFACRPVFSLVIVFSLTSGHSRGIWPC
jgi:hypothetical protein